MVYEKVLDVNYVEGEEIWGVEEGVVKRCWRQRNLLGILDFYECGIRHLGVINSNILREE